MEVVYFSNEFPKEDLTDIFRQLHKQSKSTNHEHLARFTRDATRAIKEEIEKLPSSLKNQIPPFESLTSWSEQKELREGELCGAIDGVLLILAQLSVYIWYVNLEILPFLLLTSTVMPRTAKSHRLR